MDQVRTKHQGPSTKDYVACCLILLAGPLFLGQTQREPSLPDLLQRAGAYVQQVERDFSTVISNEEYEQKFVWRSGNARAGSSRKLTSEMSFMWMPNEMLWITIRNVLRLDGAPVPDSRQRIEAAIDDQNAGRVSQLRRLRDEGARFNIGRISRNFSDPMLGLQVVEPGFQPRFTFSVAGAERIRGVDTVHVTFVEHGSPTLIRRGTDFQDLPTHGDVWIHAEDGVIHQTRLVTVDNKFDTRSTITVQFAHDSKLERWLPQRMDEEYVRQGVETRVRGAFAEAFTERIECVATYANYRRFETSGRVLQ